MRLRALQEGRLNPFPQTLGLNKFESNLLRKAQDFRTRSDAFFCVAIWTWAFDPFFGFLETISGDINEEQARGKGERPGHKTPHKGIRTGSEGGFLKLGGTLP